MESEEFKKVIQYLETQKEEFVATQHEISLEREELLSSIKELQRLINVEKEKEKAFMDPPSTTRLAYTSQHKRARSDMIPLWVMQENPLGHKSRKCSHGDKTEVIQKFKKISKSSNNIKAHFFRSNSESCNMKDVRFGMRQLMKYPIYWRINKLDKGRKRCIT